ncbi:unnamed protein product [Schistosoma spindalis]|nr:unnamed protein product [Schistosoma spindale]CAI2734360.1 unnamed protein product [Schistosoma spindale]
MKWNNSDAKCLKIRVTLHESELEFNISPKSTGKYLFDLVCSTIGLRETWYFGLQFYSFFPNGRMQLSHWLKLDKKIVSQKPEDISKSLCFFFHTKFFPEDVEQELIQATTRRLFYLSVKSTILNRSESNMNGNCFGDLCPSLDVAILLASLASQAEYGDLCEEELSDTEELTYLPRRILRLIPAQLWTQIQSTQGVTQKFREHYKSHKGMNRDKAELQYLKVAQMHNLFGVDFFPIVYVRMKFPRTLSSTQNESTLWDNTNQCHANAWLGVTAAGLQLYGKCQRDPPQFTFPWNMIKNVSYRERKFTIKLTSTCRGTNKPSQNTSIHTLLNETRGPVVISSKASQPNRSPLISITGQAFVGVAVGSSAGGSGTSAASLPSTPISARLVPSVPPVSPNLLDTSVNLSSPRAVSKFESCDTAQQLGASKGFKGRAKVLELGSRCIPGLSIKSSRYSANEFAVTRTSVNCLRGPRVQSAENNVSLPSKSLLKSSNLNSETVLISVVEVWLADPNQAKTVMSMCAGNHSLFMRRRQPDSIEVQQMRAQAREERARREVVLYPSYLVTNLGPVYPDGAFCGIAIKSLLSGNHCLTGKIPVVSVGESISKEPEASFAPFVIVSGSLPALHNDEVLNSKSRTGPTDVSHCNHNPCACAVMSTEHQPPTICHIHSPPQTIIREVSYTVPTSVLRHPQYYTPSCHVQFVPHDPVDRSQYMYSSPSLAAILSPIVTQRLHRRMSNRPQPNRGLKRQQPQPKSSISSDSVHIPLIERSTSYMQIPYSENDCGLASTEEFNLTNKDFLSRPTSRGCSFQYTPCSTNVHSKYHDFQTGRRYPTEVYPNPLLYYQFHSPTTNEYLRRATSLDVSSGNNDLLWNLAPHELLSRTSERNEDENVYLLESNPPYSQRSFLTNQLQEERAHFAFLQTQFSRQLCDTWGYLKAARGQQCDKLCDLATHGIGSNIYNNPSSYGCELRCDPAGASDGASTGGGNICSMCGSSAYDGHDHLHDTSPDHHFYEPYSQLNQDISSPDDSGVSNLRLMINGGRSENKLEGNVNVSDQEWQSSAQSRFAYMNLYTQSTKAF